MLLHDLASQLDSDLAYFPKHSIKKRGDVDPNAADEIKFPTLYIAIVFGKTRRRPILVRQLRLFLINSLGLESVVKSLIQNGTDVNINESWIPLHTALAFGMYLRSENENRNIFIAASIEIFLYKVKKILPEFLLKMEQT